MKRKIVFIGGGSLRTLGVIRDWIIQGDVAEDSRIYVMDIDERRGGIISSLARQMPEMQGRNIQIDGSTDIDRALEGADFVYNLIRAGGVSSMTCDKRIGMKYGFHGHDDFGPSAAMITLRTVPAVLKITAEMEKRCPDAWLLNFTNPAGFIARAVKDFSKIRVMGLCGGDHNQIYDIPTTLGWDVVPCKDIWYRGVGIDHFFWSTELRYKEKDFYPDLLERISKLDRDKMLYYCRMSVEVLELYGQWLSPSAHCFHWTHHEQMLAIMRDAFTKVDKSENRPRAISQEIAMDEAEKCIGKELSEQFWRQEPLKNIPSPVGEPVLGIKIISSMLTDTGVELAVNIHAPGAVDNLPDDAVVLISARLKKDGPEPLRFKGVPEGVAGLTRQILQYQKYLVQAAACGSRKDLENAIFMDPMMRDIPKVRAMLDELLEANRGKIRPELLKW